MIKLLVLQSTYGLSYPELERQANDKISFLRFLGFPEKVPDQTTVWYFRERLSKTKKDKSDLEGTPKTTGGKRIEDPERCNLGCDIHHGRSRTCICGYPTGR
jgi:IS5 family transposase